MRIHESGTDRSPDTPTTSNTSTAPSPTLASSPCAPITTTTTTTASSVDDTDTVDFSCPHCPRTFTSSIGLVGHLRIHRTETGEPVPGAPTYTHHARLNCPHCPRTFRHRMGLFGHMCIHDDLRTEQLGSTSSQLVLPKSIKDYTYFNVSGCSVFFAQKVELIKYLSNSSCSVNVRATLSPLACRKFPLTNYSHVRLMFQLLGNNMWNLKSGVIFLDGAMHNLFLTIPYTPKSYGFKCTKMAPALANGSTPSAQIVFTGLQVQPFDAVDGRFGDANDCVGFFTSGIISNLLIVFLLLGIFSYGLSMVMGIQTNDAFDDPKSKMLQIGSTTD
ncbi:V-type proton ATPase subunit [Sparganum proliferum]